MTLPAFLSTAVDSWADLYGHHQWVSVTVRSLHLAGLVVGGGTALATDRQILRAARRGPPERAAVAETLDAAHRVVVPSLALVAITGLLMTASDSETFLASRVYWSKMGLVTLLLLNGLALLAAERGVAAQKPKAWTWMCTSSSISPACCARTNNRRTGRPLRYRSSPSEFPRRPSHPQSPRE